jgi:single-strand DNA-binding protein
MSGVNKVILLGNLGKDPESFTFENGNKKVSFSIATSEKYKDKEGNTVEQTEWHNIAIFGKLADIAEKYLKKGSKVYLEGKLKTRSWDDKDGNKKYMTEVEINTFGGNLQMLGEKQEQQSSSPAADTSAPEDMDNLPF